MAPLSARTFLVYGLLAGLLAGIVAFTVAFTAGEPQVDAAIAVEEANSPAPEPGTPAEPELVSRDTQKTIGLATGSIAMGLVYGGMTGLVAALLLGRLGNLGARGSTALTALLGFLGLTLVPFLKYPATPPAVGNPDTIGHRTNLYFGFFWISVLALVGAVILARRLIDRLGAFGAIVAAAAAYLVVVVVAGAIMPTVDEIGSFPADTLWYFRRASLMTTASLWATVGVVLTFLVGRAYTKSSSEAARREFAASL